MNTKQSIPLYRDGRHYDALNSFLVADIPFYVNEAKRAQLLDIPPYRKERGKVGRPENPHPPVKSAGSMGHPQSLDLATYNQDRGNAGRRVDSHDENPHSSAESAGRTWHPVLELACGTGRLTIPIAQGGVEIVGLDIAPSMLAHARAKAETAGVKIQFVEGDCRSFNLGRKFALVFIAFNSMQHVHDYESLAAMFRNVRKHLAEDGRFVFDVFNPKVEILSRANGDRRLERKYQDPDGKGTMAFEYSGTYNDATQVSRIQCYFVRRGPNGEELDVREEQLHLRSFFPQELDLLVRSQGFEMVEKFGNFERKPFASGDPKQVVVCRAR